MEFKDYIDGLVIVSKTWTLIKPGDPLMLNVNVIISRLMSNDVRGVDCFRLKEAVKVSFQALYGLQFSVVVSSDLGGTMFNFRHIRNAFIKAVDDAIESLSSATMTKSHWKGRCCSKYADWVSMTAAQRNCKCNRKKSLLSIWGEDIHTWGQKFLSVFREQLDLNYEEFELDLMLCRLGQNSSFDGTSNLLRHFDLEKSHSIVMHMARDFQKQGSCLFWSELFMNTYYRKRPHYKYNPGFTCLSCGNFRWIFTENEDRSNDNPNIREIKPYSSIAKEIHRGDPAPFECPKILHIILGKAPKCDKDIGMYEGWLRALEANTTGLKQSKRVIARIETIILWKWPKGNVLEEFKRLFDDDFEEEKMAPLMVEASFDHFDEKHIDGILLPLLTFMKRLLADWRCKLQRNKNFLPTFHDMTMASCVEGLLSWWIYGTFKTHLGFDSFPDRLRKFLGINAEWTRGSLLQGLPKNCPIKIVHHRNAEPGHQSTDLKTIFTGKYHTAIIDVSNWHLTSYSVNDESLDTLIFNVFDCINKLKEIRIISTDDDSFDFSDEQQRYEATEQDEQVMVRLANAIWTVISSIHSSFLEEFSGNWDRLLSDKFTNDNDGSKENILKPKSTKELIRLIIEEGEMFPHQNLQQLFLTIREVCIRPVIDRFVEISAAVLERTLWKSQQMACLIPLNEETRIVLIPYSSVFETRLLPPQASELFSSLSLEARTRLIKNYKIILFQRYGIQVSSKDISDTLIEIEQTCRPSNLNNWKLTTALECMCTNYMKRILRSATLQ